MSPRLLPLAALAVLVAAGCSGSSDGAAEPGARTSVVSCAIEDGLPVAEVVVTNSTSKAGRFDVIVQFKAGSSVLGTGEEYTPELQPDENATVRMGSQGGDEPAVDACVVQSADRM